MRPLLVLLLRISVHIGVMVILPRDLELEHPYLMPFTAARLSFVRLAKKTVRVFQVQSRLKLKRIKKNEPIAKL